MHWEILIIPLIALGVWILGTLFRGVEDERQRNRPRRPGEGGSRVPPRRSGTDLERFLEESRRRREAAERAPASEEPFFLPSPPLPAARERAPRGERRGPRGREGEMVAPGPAPRRPVHP